MPRPPPYDKVFSNAHSVVRWFAGGGPASTGAIGDLTMADLIPRTVGLFFSGGYQLFIACNESYYELNLFDSLADAKEQILFGILPHLVLGLQGVVYAIRRQRRNNSKDD